MPMIHRHLEPIVEARLRSNAAVVLLGPRQVGKTTLARDLADAWPAGSVYLDLGGIAIDEAAAAGMDADTLWVRGGYPLSLTAADDETSAQWRSDLVRSYLERDVPKFAPRIPAETLRRLWTMVAHHSGQLLNATRLAAARSSAPRLRRSARVPGGRSPTWGSSPRFSSILTTVTSTAPAT